MLPLPVATENNVGKVAKKPFQSNLSNFVVKVKVHHELDNNNNYVKTSTTNAITGEIVNTFPVYRSTEINQCDKRKRVTFELVCGLFSVSPEPGNHRPSFHDIKKRKAATDIANRCSVDASLNAIQIAETEFSEFMDSKASAAKWLVDILINK